MESPAGPIARTVAKGSEGYGCVPWERRADVARRERGVHGHVTLGDGLGEHHGCDRSSRAICQTVVGFRLGEERRLAVAGDCVSCVCGRGTAAALVFMRAPTPKAPSGEAGPGKEGAGRRPDALACVYTRTAYVQRK